MQSRSLTKTLAALIAILSPASAMAQTWHVVGTGGQPGDRAVWFIDEGSIRSDGNNKQFWIKVISEKPSVGRDRYIALKRADCQSGTVLELQVSTYFGKSPMGNVPPMTIKYPVPGSSLDMVLQVACGQKKSLFPVVDADEFAARMFRQ